MTRQQELGRRGEEIAKEHLIQLGYEILDCNWRYQRAEIDIIAMDGPVLVCIEVKSRSYDYFGPPDTGVTQKKEQLLVEALQQYMIKIDHEWEVRFDIISVRWESEGGYHLQHIKAAFFPGLA